MEMMVWNVVLTAIVALLGFVVKEKLAELQRISVLLNRTREEMARDHITRAEFRADMAQLMERFDRIERKIDAMRENTRAERV